MNISLVRTFLTLLPPNLRDSSMIDKGSGSSYRRNYLLLCVGGLSMMLATGLTDTILPLYAATFTSELLLIGAVVSSFWILRAAFEIPFGIISECVGRKKPVLIGTLLGSLGAILIAGTGSLSLIFAGQALRGVSQAAFFCVSLAFLTEIAPPQSRGKAMGTLQAIEWGGMVSGNALGGLLASWVGYRGVFWTCVPIASIAFASTLLLVASDRRAERKILLAVENSFKGISSMANLAMFGVCALVFTLVMSDSGLMKTIMPLYSQSSLAMTLTGFSLIMASRSVGVVFGTFSGGWLSDRIKRVKTLIAGSILSMLSVLFLPATGVFAIIMFLMFLNGIAYGYVYGSVPVMVTEMFPAKKGLAIGLYRTFFDLGGIVGPYIVTVVGLSSYAAPFFLMTCLFAANSVFLGLLNYSKRLY